MGSSASPLRGLLFIAVLGAATACNGGTTGTSQSITLTFTSGQQQTGPVGSALPVKVIVGATDSHGPVASLAITVATDASGGGSVAPSSATTGTDGTAQFSWTLGGKVGTQTLTASTTGQSPVRSSITAIATVGPPSAVVTTSVVFQYIVVGHAVTTLPSVQVTDGFGNGISGVPVTFETVQGASIITGASQTTDANGRASVGGWSIGPDALTYTIRGRIASGAVGVFEAQGIPASVTATAGTGQSGNVGTAVPILPAVRATRDDGSPLPNVAVSFTVTSGGGVVTGASAVTGVDGIARPIRWILGTSPGLNRLEASILGRPTNVAFDATGIPAVPASAVASSGTSLSGFFGNFLAGTPEVTVTDAQGNPVAAVTVSFQVTQGGGQLTGVSPRTDYLGHAAPTGWRLGSAGTQMVSATMGALPPVTFTATASTPPASTFRIEIRYPHTQPTAAQRAAFDAAVARWTQLLLAGAAPYQVVATDVDPSGTCPSMLGELVDGIVIYADLIAIDGPGRVLGSTGVCVVRDQGFLPVEGLMQFDTADLPTLESSGQLGLVILHEMAHALGFGTIWYFDGRAQGLGFNNFLSGAPGSDPTFNGTAARTAFYGAAAPGTTFTGNPVPVEATGGGGTAYSHWRETVFANELMTGFLNSGVNPLSAVTVDQFRDLGYVVNDALSDVYTFQAFIQAASVTPSLRLVEGQLPGSITVINRKGGVVARVPRIYK